MVLLWELWCKTGNNILMCIRVHFTVYRLYITYCVYFSIYGVMPSTHLYLYFVKCEPLCTWRKLHCVFHHNHFWLLGSQALTFFSSETKRLCEIFIFLSLIWGMARFRRRDWVLEDFANEDKNGSDSKNEWIERRRKVSLIFGSNKSFLFCKASVRQYNYIWE